MSVMFKIPEEKIADLCKRHGIQELALFGSALTDKFGSQSDVDLLVTFRPDARVGFLTLAKAQRELEDLIGRAVDLVPKGGLKPAIRDSVLASARVLYAA
jgi:predicted nucleotidyltransferase